MTQESAFEVDGDANTVTYEFTPESHDQVTTELYVTDDGGFTMNETVTINFASSPESG
ncbi:hypothetical protein [Halorubrum luteum]